VSKEKRRNEFLLNGKNFVPVKRFSNVRHMQLVFPVTKISQAALNKEHGIGERLGYKFVYTTSVSALFLFNTSGISIHYEKKENRSS
jgi:hypothetical protein